jgi:serine/threonine-protein kinase RsbW
MAAEVSRRHSLTLASELAASGKGSEWARALAGESGLPEDRIAALDLCIVELVTNIVSHAYRGTPGEIRLDLDLAPGVAILTVTDAGPAFDPLSVPSPVVAASLEEATIGGYGIHLVRTSANACRYERRNGTNVFTARFGAPTA